MKRIILVDIRPMASRLHQEWDGVAGGTFNKFLTMKAQKTRILESIKDIAKIKQSGVKYNLAVKDREVVIEVTWLEQENINIWSANTQIECQMAVNRLNQRGLMSYIAQ